MTSSVFFALIGTFSGSSLQHLMSEENERGYRGFKGVFIPRALWEHPDLTWMEKCLVAEIDSLSSVERGPCHASAEYLASWMQTTPIAIRKSLSRLMEKKIIWQIGFDGRICWRCVAPRYAADQSQYEAWSHDERWKQLKCHSSCDLGVTPGVTAMSQQVCPGGHTDILEEILEDKLDNNKRESGDSFEFFPDEKKEVTKKEKIGAQLPLDPIEQGLEEAVIASDRPKGMPALSVIKTEVAKHGLPVSDAEYLYDSWLLNGYTLKGGKRIQDWKASIRVWKRNEWFPSQRKAAKAKPIDDKERVRAAVERMRRNADPDHP